MVSPTPRNEGSLFRQLIFVHTGTSKKRDIVPRGLFLRIAAAQADTSQEGQNADERTMKEPPITVAPRLVRDATAPLLILV